MLRHAEPNALQFWYFGTAASCVNGSINLATYAAGDLGSFSAPYKCEVVEAMALVKVAFVGASISSAKIKMDKRVNCGSDTNRGDGDVAEINFGYTGASLQGACVYDLAGQGVMLEPGQEVVVENMYNGAGITAGGIWPMLAVRVMPEVRANLSRMKETT
jgi:hypothetical protein